MRKLALLIFLAACTSKTDSTQQTSAIDSAAKAPASNADAALQPGDSALAPEVSPLGDIPDTQAFVKYSNTAAGYQLEVPEGWARAESGSDVTFADKFSGVKVSATPATSAPTAATALTNEVSRLKSGGHAVRIDSVTDVNLPGGKAVRITYTSNSDPNAVTNKRVRLEDHTYLFYKNGKVGTVTFYAPQGADNVDQWNRMSRSFRWL